MRSYKRYGNTRSDLHMDMSKFPLKNLVCNKDNAKTIVAYLSLPL